MARRSPGSYHSEPGPNIPACSICQGVMFIAYDRYQQKVCVCADCHTSITIPGSAWDVAGLKRESRKVTPERRQRQGRRAGDQRMQ